MLEDRPLLLLAFCDPPLDVGLPALQRSGAVEDTLPPPQSRYGLLGSSELLRDPGVREALAYPLAHLSAGLLG
jgi:hypothetical protein